MGKPDPNAVILEKLNAIRDEIIGSLGRIEEEPKILKKWYFKLNNRYYLYK